MSIERLTLDEWFLIHQLDKIKKDHFHLPFLSDVKITSLHQKYSNAQEKTPVTAILVKALGHLAYEYPEINQMIFRTFWGIKKLRPEYISINLPIMVHTDGKRVLSAITIKEPQTKSVQKIQEEIRSHKYKERKDLPIGKFHIGKKNNFFNRLRLRLIHWSVYNFPQIYEKYKGGTMALSSLMNLDNENWETTLVAYGPSSITLGCCNIHTKNNETYLKLSCSYDHMIGGGEIGMKALKKLNEILLRDNLFIDIHQKDDNSDSLPAEEFQSVTNDPLYPQVSVP
jgi:hypothetical protein